MNVKLLIEVIKKILKNKIRFNEDAKNYDRITHSRIFFLVFR